MQTEAFAIEDATRANGLFATWAAWIIVGALIVWAYSGEGIGRYVLYTVPLFLVAVHLVLNRLRPRLDGASLIALGLYALAVFASFAVNPHPGPFAERDLLIIFGYIVIFCLYLEAPAAVADVVLFGLSGGLLIEAQRKGVSFDINFADSQGMVESVLAFPLGGLSLYYLSDRRWGRALIAGLVFLVAFKRIALVGVGMVVLLDLVTRHLSIAGRRRVFVAFVILACFLALSSEWLFNELATLSGTDSSNAASLGRTEIAVVLWTNFLHGGELHHLFGFGPGAADTWVAKTGLLENPHNDWLKILVDYGAFGVLFWIAILAKLFPRTASATSSISTRRS